MERVRIQELNGSIGSIYTIPIVMDLSLYMHPFQYDFFYVHINFGNMYFNETLLKHDISFLNSKLVFLWNFYFTKGILASLPYLLTREHPWDIGVNFIRWYKLVWTWIVFSWRIYNFLSRSLTLIKLLNLHLHCELSLRCVG